MLVSILLISILCWIFPGSLELKIFDYSFFAPLKSLSVIFVVLFFYILWKNTLLKFKYQRYATNLLKALEEKTFSENSRAEKLGYRAIALCPNNPLNILLSNNNVWVLKQNLLHAKIKHDWHAILAISNSIKTTHPTWANKHALYALLKLQDYGNALALASNNRDKAIIHYLMYRQSLNQDNLTKAVTYDPGLVPAACELSKMRGKKILQNALKHTLHWDLANAWPEEAKYQELKELIPSDNYYARAILAQIAYQEGFKNVSTLGNPAGWECSSCYIFSQTWQEFCPNCEQYDSLEEPKKTLTANMKTTPLPKALENHR